MGFFSNIGFEPYDREYSDRELVRRISQYFRPHGRRLVRVSILVITTAIALAAVPVLVSSTINELKGGIASEAIWFLGGAVFFSGVIYWGLNWARVRLIARTVGDIVLAIQTDAFRASAAHDLSFYDKYSSGRIVSRITSDTREFGQVVTLITDLIAQIFQAAFVAMALAAAEPQLLLYLLGFIPIVFVFAFGFRSMTRKFTRRGMRAMGNVNAAIKETISGIGVAKNFRQEERIFNDFDDANKTSFRVNMQSGFLMSFIFPTLNILSGVGTGLLLYIGGWEAAKGVITIGAWFLFLQSLERFWFPILNLSAFWSQVQAGLSAAERAFALIDAESKVIQVSTNEVPRLKGDICFEKVWFRYSEQEQVLQDFDLHIQPGENVALVGHTGAGKSSIAKLTARFYEFQEGDLTIDGKDIRSFDLTQFRGQLGVVSQTPFLFSGTVAENIRYARPEASDEQILELANKIGEGEWLEILPQGLETEVGERGGRLSMGQRQLVSLLRVLVQEPAIFILDEATASIDPFTEWQIQQALKLILQNTTSILIAHRLSTVKAADRIIVLEDGQIIEEGNHESLLAKEGNYASLYNTYFRHQSLAYVEKAVEFAEGEGK